MTVWRLAIREICHRKLSFLMSVISVTTAIACLVGAQTLLRADRVITEHLLEKNRSEVEQVLAATEDVVKQAGADLEDAMRKHMLGLGFNILILPKEQSRSELLLPSVTRRVLWPEHNLEVILIGTRGEVPIQHRESKKPLLEEVAEGEMVVGNEIRKELGLKVGDISAYSTMCWHRHLR